MDIRENIIFTIARMNPPTPGHLLLVRRLIQEAITTGTDKVYILLSKTDNDKENPLDCRYKQSILGNEEELDLTDTMIENEKQIMIDETTDEDLRERIRQIKVITKCAVHGSPVSLISPLIKSTEYEGKRLNLFLIIGIDRKELLDSIIKSFSKQSNVDSVGGIALTRPDMERYKSLSPRSLTTIDIDTVPVEALSASFIRKIVMNDLKVHFDKIYSRHLSQVKINELYKSIQSVLLSPNSSNSKTGKRKPNSNNKKTKRSRK